ncbi:glycosyltransferase [Acidaminococcus fermentans]|uniref:glycosyltransferase n=1 Tax=Acidaminococcus fermentans TaxID=905 RepID=UPI002490BF7E|nr:glycosyltransferase [Acidaminococcus fermentans]
MNILYITDNNIMGHGGGCLGALKYYSAIKAYALKENANFKVISLGQNMPEAMDVEVVKNRNLDKSARLHGHSNFMYFIWKKNKNKIMALHPDVVLLGRTRLGFIAKEMKNSKPEIKIITFVDNIEYDYVDSYFSLAKGIKDNIFRQIEKRVVKNDEADAVNYSDRLIYLTHRDVQRCRELYHHVDSHEYILPICLEHTCDLKIKSPLKTVAFVGSLGYGANVSAVEMLIKKIWIPNFAENEGFQLIIAGGNPVDEIHRWTKLAHNIKLVADFDKIENFLPQNSLMVAPIPTGAGMKVKVAETLSMGLPIAGSDEALVGYEDAIREDKLGGIQRVNNVEEYVQAIWIFSRMNTHELAQIEVENKNIFKKYYTFDTAKRTIEKCMMEL